jgi:heme/copper-type cytochrome/quinol oxidase subunit 2
MLSIAMAVAEHEELAPLIMPPAAFAGIAAAVFVVLAFITWSYRDVANRHSDKVSASDHADSGHQSSHH